MNRKISLLRRPGRYFTGNARSFSIHFFLFCCTGIFTFSSISSFPLLHGSPAFLALPAAAPQDAGIPGEVVDIASLEKKMLDLVNQERQKRGLSLLQDHRQLSAVSYGHSLKMANEKKLSHSFPAYPSLGERLQAAGLTFLSAGENVAFSQVYQAEEVHRGFMNSPRHRDNILDSGYTHCGIRIARDGRDLYVTQEFAQLFVPLEAEQIVQILEQELAASFQEKHGSRLSFVSTARENARYRAQNYLLGKQVKNRNPGWGNFYVINFISPNIERLKKQVVEQAGKIDFWAASLGAAVGEQPGTPGTTYAVSAILFPGSKYLNMTGEDLAAYLRQAVDKIRKQHRKKLFTYDKTLSGEARQQAEEYFTTNEKWSKRRQTRQMLIFQAYKPEEIPADFVEVLATRDDNMKLGIGVFVPLQQGYPCSYFVVCMIIAYP